MKRYLDLDDISNVNCSSVLNVIREAGEISRKGISDETGLSWAGMTKIVNKLFENGYLEESKSKAEFQGVGRIPNLIKICKDRNVVIGLDINRQGFIGKVVNLAGDQIAEYTSSIYYRGKEELLEKIISFTSRIVEFHRHQRITAISVAMQGQVDSDIGISMKFPHCKDWENVPIKKILEDKFKIKVYVEHDPNCMLYAAIGRERVDNCILFRIDKSIGMAAYIDGSIMRGNGLLEVKNCIVVPEGKECKCSKRGSLEAYVCRCTNGKRYNEEGVKEFIPLFSNFIYNMCHLFHAKRVILTGDLISYHVLFEEQLIESFEKFQEDKEIEIVFEEEIGKVAYGAALIGVQAVINELSI